MVSDSRLSNLVLTVASFISLAAAPLRAVDFPAAPLSDLSPDALRTTAAAAIKEGAWSPWSDWLASLLRTAFAQPDLKDPHPITSTPAGSLALAQWRLIAVTGPDHCKAVAEKDGTEFLTWLTANNEALHAYLASGPLDREITSRGLAIWRDLFNAHPESREGLWKRVAAATRVSALLAYPIQFTCTLADNKRQLSGAELYVKDNTLTLVPTFERLDGELLARNRESVVHLSIPAGALKPGTYNVTLVGETSSRTWTLQVN